MEDKKNITLRLQKLVKRKNTPVVVIKAGSIKKIRRISSGSSFEGDYYPSSYAE